MTSSGGGRRRRRRMAQAAAQQGQPIPPSQLASITPLPRPERSALASPSPAKTRKNPRPRHLHAVPDQPPRIQQVVLAPPPVHAFKEIASPRQRPLNPWVIYGSRCVIVLVGIAVLAGTAIVGINPTPPNAIAPTAPLGQNLPPLKLGQNLDELGDRLQTVTAPFPDLEPAVFILDLDTYDFVNLNGTASIAAASTIKLPLLVAAFQEIDAGGLTLQEGLVMKPDLIATGSGTMQYDTPGRTYSVGEVLEKMIIISDNTATNMLLHRLGGAARVNQRFSDWGLTATSIANDLPDLGGTNVTTPIDLVHLLAQIHQGEIVSLESRDRLLNILQRVERRELLPQGLDERAVIAHKTGDIGTMLGDVGMVETPTGKRYAIAILVRRPHNDDRARLLIQNLSRTTYEHFLNAQP
ncbi:serine hydrolase [Spirulina sp. CCNP1310]|uniref:serine hydrolase n=1 Tax=Spirulina sp. CCNP1310 TaxID=3110249 RepID=UPI002B1FF5DC|nr:serine hydrolase [Spirulina sp. CCNP1310]MEA5417878.1 serine hydrolase [Spirulina sp. CCNP1310]